MVDSFQIKTSVCFLVFNRPDTTSRVFEEIRHARPPKLLVVADGPRLDRPGEAEKCAAARAIIEQVDWPCEVMKNYLDTNLGCKRRVSSGLDWVFETVTEAIILEDDCLPNPSFFRFCEELLEKYRDDERVIQIGGCNFQDGIKRGPASYYFSIYNHIWGWASWRRAWKHYDRDMSLWPALRSTDWLLTIGGGSKAFQQYWTKIFDTVYSGQVDTWDYQWTFSCWAQSGFTILPARNLVTNIGFGKDASHTKDNRGAHANLSLEVLEFPLSYPLTMVQDLAADKWSDEHVFGIFEEAHWKKTMRKIPGLDIALRRLR
jgi:hypothetical protein